MKVLLIDNLDSFSFMLKDYLEQCGAQTDIVRNTADILSIRVADYGAIVISPGPETPEKAGNLIPFIQQHFNTRPLLGVCLGHQAIGELFGARLIHAEQPKHGKVDAISYKSDLLFQNMPNPFQATRYHSLILENLPEELMVIAETSQHEVMAIRHKHLPIWGVQFHPESCQTQTGIKIIENFLRYAENKC